MKREQSDERHMQYASPSCFIIVAILLFLSGKSNSFAISSFYSASQYAHKKENNSKERENLNEDHFGVVENRIID